MDDQAYVLDDGYDIKRKEENKESFNDLLKQARNLTKLAPSSNQIALLEAHISLALQQERENVINTWNVLCKSRARIQKLEQFILSTFPESSSNWLENRGVHLDIAGDAIAVGNCALVPSYTIYYNGKHNGTCYFYFPIKLPCYSKKIYFLHLQSRSLINHSPKIKCRERSYRT